ncbi:MMPL family transporter [endosymbiont of Lamellibrachia barhami]|uniref:MMPL family transporter n=1 Tax=endosymbiont of Lamellibrachia barhami TaxID=205975 RepID=UPI0015AB17F8|nr:MMPL family transporter [endosymbiont of Lamellibrachia barhami]
MGAPSLLIWFGRITAILAVPICLYYLSSFTPDERPTLEQMLPPQDQGRLEEIRTIFGIEPNRVIIGIKPEADPNSVERLKQQIRAIDDVADVMQLSIGGQNARLLIIGITAGNSTMQAARRLEKAIAASTAAFADTVAATIGTPQIRVASWQSAYEDMRDILPWLLISVTLIPYLFFRSLSALLFPLFVASISCTLILLLVQHIERNTGLIAVVLIPIVWSIATLDAIHLIDRTARLAGKRDTFFLGVEVRALAHPCLLTTLTTAGALLILALQEDSPLLHDLGIWAGAGALLAYLLTFFTGTLFLSTGIRHRPVPNWPRYLALQAVRYSQHHAKRVLTAWVALLCIALSGLPSLQLTVRFPSLFHASHTLEEEIDKLATMSGTDLRPVDVFIEAIDDAGADRMTLLNAARAVRNYAKTWPETKRVLPFAGGLETTTASKPGTEEAALSDWFKPDSATARVQLHFAPHSFQRHSELIDWLRHFDRTVLSQHRLWFGGTGYDYHRMEQLGAKAGMMGLTGSLAIILATLLWTFRGSTENIVPALIALLLPALLIGGIMGHAGIPWSLGMMLLPVIYIGLAVDYTLHLLWPLRHSQRSLQRRLQSSALRAGPALLTTTAVIATCTAALSLSTIQVNRELGGLLAVGLTFALLSSLTLTPAIFTLWRHRSVRY